MKEDTLIIESSRKVEDYIIIKKAILEQYCNKCKRIHKYFVLGGVVFGNSSII